MAVKLRQLGSACKFYMAEEYVFDEEKKKALSAHLFPEEYYMLNCSGIPVQRFSSYTLSRSCLEGS